MVDTTSGPDLSNPALAKERGITGFLRATEVDTRLLGMIGALAIIWVGFHFLTDGTFLTARNLWNLSVQASVVAIVATGMVLVIVTRNIDLSVGSVLGVLGMIMAVVQVEWLPDILGFEHPMIWLITLVLGILAGAVIGAFQGMWIAYAKVPAFIVTLGGLLIFRGAAWWVTSGRTVAPLDTNFQILGGGISGSIGEFWSWIVGAIAIVAIVIMAVRSRQARKRYGFPTKPIWAEFTLTGVALVGVIGFVVVMNSYYQPERTVAAALIEPIVLERDAAGGDLAAVSPETRALIATFPPSVQEGLADPDVNPRRLIRDLADWEDLPQIPRGIAVPVLIMLGVAVAMSFTANTTKFGRYIFAIGGNPEAAELAGVNTKRVIFLIFVLMGVLCAIAGAVQSARLNAGANATGTLLELSAIAAAVIGGTSLAGGVGTIAGAILGALVMQSLQSGMLLLNIDTPLQNIVIGLVLVLAVWVDTIYQKRRK